MNDDTIKELSRQMTEHERRLHEGDISFALLRQMTERIQADLSEVKSLLKTMQERPARRWESVMNCVINWAVAALLAYVAIGG